MWTNDIKCKDMFMFPQKNLAPKGLKSCETSFCTDFDWNDLLSSHAKLWPDWMVINSPLYILGKFMFLYRFIRCFFAAGAVNFIFHHFCTTLCHLIVILPIWNLLYLWQNNLTATKWKMNVSIEHLASNVTISFDLGHDLEFGFSMSNF